MCNFHLKFWHKHKWYAILLWSKNFHLSSSKPSKPIIYTNFAPVDGIAIGLPFVIWPQASAGAVHDQRLQSDCIKMKPWFPPKKAQNWTFTSQGGSKGRHVTYRVEEGVEGPWSGSEESWNSSKTTSNLKRGHQARPISEKEPEPYCFPCFRWSLIMVSRAPVLYSQTFTSSYRWAWACWW